MSERAVAWLDDMAKKLGVTPKKPYANRIIELIESDYEKGYDMEEFKERFMPGGERHEGVHILMKIKLEKGWADE